MIVFSVGADPGGHVEAPLPPPPSDEVALRAAVVLAAGELDTLPRIPANCLNQREETDFGVSFRYDFQSGRDDLCFENGAASLSEGQWPLGAIGSRQGACSGMSAVVGAFLENVRFRPTRPREAADQWPLYLETALKLRRAGCSDRLDVPGFTSLRQLCEADPVVTMNSVLAENARLAVGPFLAEIVQRNLNPENPLDTTSQAMSRIRRSLRDGKSALLLLPASRESRFPHTVLVHGLRTERDPTTGTHYFVLHVYDSNNNCRLADDPSCLSEIRLPFDPETGRVTSNQIESRWQYPGNPWARSEGEGPLWVYREPEEPGRARGGRDRCCSIVMQSSWLFPQARVNQCREQSPDTGSLGI